MNLADGSPVGLRPAARRGGSVAGGLTRALLAFSVVPLALMAAALYSQTRDLLLVTQEAQAQRLLSRQLAEGEHEAAILRDRLESLARQPDFQAMLDLALAASPDDPGFEAIRRGILDAFIQQNGAVGPPTFRGLFVLDRTGTIRVASDPEMQGLAFPSAPGFSPAAATTSSALVFDAGAVADSELALLTSVARPDPAGGVSATIIATSDLVSLRGALQYLTDLGPQALAFVVVPPAHVITVDPTTGNFTDQPTTWTGLEQLTSPSSGPADSAGVELGSPDGERVQARLTWAPGLNVAAGFAISSAAVQSRLTGLIPFMLLLIALVLAVIGLIISIGTTRAMRPLRILTDITARFATGDWSGRAPHAGARNEIGRLASSFNHMADELSGLYRSLEEQVEERTRQVRMAAAIAQNLSGLSDLESLLAKSVELLVVELGFQQANAFMLDPAGRLAVLRASNGPAADGPMQVGHTVEVGSPSIVGWVSQKNTPRVATESAQDSVRLTRGVLPGTKSQAAVPISVGERVLGVLDVHSAEVGAFSPETIVMLQTLASQIAAAVQNVGLVASSSNEFQDLARLFRATNEIANARDDQHLFELTGQVLREAPFTVVLLGVRESDLEILSLSDAPGIVGTTVEFQRYVRSTREGLDRFLGAGPIIVDVQARSAPPALQDIADHLGLLTAAYIPLRRATQLAGVVVLGAKQGPLTAGSIEPYTTLGQLVSVTLERLAAAEASARRFNEAQALASLGQAISLTNELDDFFAALHARARDVLGEIDFHLALLDPRDQAVEIPYRFEDGQITKNQPAPPGSSLTAIIIRTGEPLMLGEAIERRAAELGATVPGRPPRSWMGVPMMMGTQVIGAIVVQDPVEEHAFTPEHQHFLMSLAANAAGVIHNARLLDESIHRSVRLETAAQIARDISASLDLGELLAKAVELIRERFDFYHAAVFLLDSTREFAVVREASGEAGAQLKRLGHKIAVGSKSIVGTVTGRGEQLVVNDTSRDTTYLPNPLLPETRAEAAIPLRVGERILGALDVQSPRPQAFTEDDLKSLQILADQLAVAVVNTELFAETQEHLAQHRLLHHITTAAASGTTLEEALQGAVRGLQVTLGGDRVSILLADRARKELHVQAMIGYSDEVADLRIPFGSGITGWVAVHRRPLLVNNVEQDPRYIEGSPNTRAELAVPLLYRNDVLGVLNVESEQTMAYTQSDEEMLGTLGGSLAAIVANARLLEQIRERAERERAIYEITGKIRRSTDIESILATTATELSRALGTAHTKISVAPRLAEPHAQTSAERD